MSRDEVIELLKKNDGLHARELALLSGYHEKSIIRLKSKIKSGEISYKGERNKKIISDYIQGDFKNYRDFYLKQHDYYNLSYVALSKILSLYMCSQEIVFIKKVESSSSRFFEVIDNKSKTILFEFPSLKNDFRSIKKILFRLLKDFGKPKYISFVNFYDTMPDALEDILKKYSISSLTFKSIYRNSLRNVEHRNDTIRYSPVVIEREDFYNCIVRYCISQNIIQFENIRYEIVTNTPLLKGIKVILYYDDARSDIFVRYKDATYCVKVKKRVSSIKGNTKYR
ncbi:MAG TPA: hypothetical protein DCY94_02360 [Firmicutes bacterium]|nr:hypothetical protein [Bacillota bacterium]